MTATLLMVGAVLLGTGPSSHEFGPEGRIVVADNGKATFARLATYQILGIAGPSDGYLLPWGANGEALEPAAAAKYMAMVRKLVGKAPQPMPGHDLLVVATAESPWAKVPGEGPVFEPPVRVMDLQGLEGGEVYYVSVPRSVRTVKMKKTYYNLAGPWKPIAWCKPDGQSTRKDVSFHISREWDAKKGPHTANVEAGVPPVGAGRWWRVVECNVSEFPADAVWQTPEPAPGSTSRSLIVETSLPKEVRGFRVEVTPKAQLVYKLAARRNW